MRDNFIEYGAGDKHPLLDDERNISESYTLEHYKDAGREIKPNEVVVDIDDRSHEQLDKMIKEFDIQTEYYITDRGIHLVYLQPKHYKPKQEGVCPLGFNIEHKTRRGKNISHTVKLDGKAREVVNKGARLELPFIFDIKKNYDNLEGYDDGEGRNEALFKLRTKIHSDTTETEMTEIISFINENVFAEPLPLSEILSITRENVKFDTEQSTPTDTARYLIKKWGIVEYYGDIWYRNDGKLYEKGIGLLKNKILEFFGSAKSHEVDEIFKQVIMLTDNVPAEVKMQQEFPIKFKNGILQDGNFIEIDYDEFTPYYIDIDYIKDAEPVKVVDDYIDHLTNYDEDYKKIIFEMIGHIFVTNKDFKRLLASFFILVGKAGAGKGTLLTLIDNIVGGRNTTSLSIEDLADKNHLISMKKTLVNLGDDVHDSVINNEQMKLLKNLSTCDKIQGRALYKESESMTLSTSLIFTSNHILKSFEKGKAYQRRVKWLPIVNEVKEQRDIMSELTEVKALEYFIRLSIEGYFRLYKNKKLTKSKFVDDWNNEYHEENDNVVMFLEGLDREDCLGLRPKEVHEEYLIWAIENDYTDEQNRNYNKSRLYEMVEDTFNMKVGVRKVNGTSAKIYVEQ